MPLYALIGIGLLAVVFIGAAVRRHNSQPFVARILMLLATVLILLLLIGLTG
jgi:hypothetical protein